MAYADLLDNIREALGVTSAHDASLTAAITRNARFLLRNYNFRESVRRATTQNLALNAVTVGLPADAGKVKAVRLRYIHTGGTLYKRLRRMEEGSLPQRTEVGPMYYWFEPPNIHLDTPMPETGYDLEVWYQSTDPAINEAWLSTTFADVLTHRTIYELAPTKRKPEAMQVYNALWQEDLVVLANYLAELEFGDLEMKMGGDSHAYRERYPSL